MCSFLLTTIYFIFCFNLFTRAHSCLNGHCIFIKVDSVFLWFQCIQGLPEGALRRIILTASGGAFRCETVQFENVLVMMLERNYSILCPHGKDIFICYISHAQGPWELELLNSLLSYACAHVEPRPIRMRFFNPALPDSFVLRGDSMLHGFLFPLEGGILHSYHSKEI